MTSMTVCCESPMAPMRRKKWPGQHPWPALWARTRRKAHVAVRRWTERRQTLRGLSYLDERSLQDIGITSTPHGRASRSFRLE